MTITPAITPPNTPAITPPNTPPGQPSPTDSKSAWREWSRSRPAADSEPTGAQQNDSQPNRPHLQLLAGLADFLTPVLAQKEALILFYLAITPATTPPITPTNTPPITPTNTPPITPTNTPPIAKPAHEPRLDPIPNRVGWEHFAITRTPENGPLTVHAATAPLELHRYGFWQPTQDTPELPTDQIRVALVPGLLFDRHGNRLGHGMGYYDDLLNRLPASCTRVGVCWSVNVVDLLPTEPRDEPMTYLATENGVKPVREPAS